MTSPKLKLQFSIRLLLVLVGCLCVWLGVTANAARTQRELVMEILAAGGEVFYDWQVPDDGSESGLEHPPGPDWLRRWLGDEYFQSVFVVSFYETGLPDEDLPPIDRLGTIRSLTLGRTRITDAVMPRIGRLKNLEFLDIGLTKVTDAGMREIAGLRRLEQLYAGDSRLSLHEAITDRGIAYLEKLPRLELLVLEGDGITDRSIETLKKIRSLKVVWLWSNSVSDRAADALRTAPPNCEIHAESFNPWTAQWSRVAASALVKLSIAYASLSAECIWDNPARGQGEGALFLGCRNCQKGLRRARRPPTVRCSLVRSVQSVQLQRAVCFKCSRRFPPHPTDS